MTHYATQADKKEFQEGPKGLMDKFWCCIKVSQLNKEKTI